MKTKTNIGLIRWMAPESIAKRKYSKKSDVWSFGIVGMPRVFYLFSNISYFYLKCGKLLLNVNHMRILILLMLQFEFGNSGISQNTSSSLLSLFLSLSLSLSLSHFTFNQKNFIEPSIFVSFIFGR
jgi:serine/threonine protein kinase